MAVRKRGNGLEKWEVALIKAMISRGSWANDQDILAYFTRPTRSVNHRAIREIKRGERHSSTKAASDDVLDEFLAVWPDLDPHTGLSIRGDELLIKAREAMISAVHLFNSVGLTFRAELFVVTAIIAWTYLLHSWFKREGVDYRYRNSDGTVRKTKQGEDCFWDLGKCLRFSKCPIPSGAIANLEFLIALRHEIEHRSTNRIDEAVSAKLQACCINFNEAIKSLFGGHFSLEKRLPIALQFVTFSVDQRELLKKASDLPSHVETMMEEFHSKLSEAEQADPRFAYRVAFVPKVGSKATNADLAIEFIKEGSEESGEINRVLLKEIEKKRYTPSQIVAMMNKEGYRKFKLSHHTELWQSLDAKDVVKKFGCVGDYKGTWVWYESWLLRVRTHCQEHSGRYK